MPRKAVSAPGFDISRFRDIRRYVWREIERKDADAVNVKLLRLTMAEVDALTFVPTAPMADIHRQIAPYVVEWDFRAENLDTGEVISVPPPAEVGPEIFELMVDPIGMEIFLWLKTPHLMLRDQDDAKKASSSSESGGEPSSNSTSD